MSDPQATVIKSASEFVAQLDSLSKKLEKARETAQVLLSVHLLLRYDVTIDNL